MDGRFRMPNGAEIVGQQGDTYKMRVSMPADEDGFLGRECPECSMNFRLHADDYAALTGRPDSQKLWCVYCGHQADHTEFITPQQLTRTRQATQELGTQIALRAIDKAFGGLAHRPSRHRGMLSMSVDYRPKAHYPRPLPVIDEERLVRVRNCLECQARYAIFGEHRYCPVCGRLPAITVAFDSLESDRARLDALESLPAETKAALNEKGVLTRSRVDTIENLVGTVEALATSVFRATVTNADALLKGKGNIFQRLEDTADLFVDQGYHDLRPLLGPDVWRRLVEAWAARHVFTHNDGIVDAKYLAKVPTARTQVGQRLVISGSMCEQAIDDATALCTALGDLTA